MFIPQRLPRLPASFADALRKLDHLVDRLLAIQPHHVVPEHLPVARLLPRAHVETATTNDSIPLSCFGGEGLGERRPSNAGKLLRRLFRSASMPLSPAPSPRFAGGAREKLPVAVSNAFLPCAPGQHFEEHPQHDLWPALPD